jgi:cysteine synthase
LPANEILQQLDGKIDMIVTGVGIGGIISGITAKIRRPIPIAKLLVLILLDLFLNDPGRLSSYHVEGFYTYT